MNNDKIQIPALLLCITLLFYFLFTLQPYYFTDIPEIFITFTLSIAIGLCLGTLLSLTEKDT